MKKALLLIPILAASLLAGCAKGNAYKPEDITLDQWLDGAENTRNNMYNIYPESKRPVDLDGNDAVDWDNYIINTIKSNVTSTTTKKKTNHTTDSEEEYLWYFLRNPKQRTGIVLLYIYEDHIITRTDINYAGEVIPQILYYDLQPYAGEAIINAAKDRMIDVYESEAYETETAKMSGTMDGAIYHAKTVEANPIIYYQGSGYIDDKRSFLDDLTFEECRKWTSYFKEDSDDSNMGSLLFSYEIDENLMVGVDIEPHYRILDGELAERNYLIVKYTYERAFPHHKDETVTYYSFYEVPKRTVQRLESKIISGDYPEGRDGQ